MADNIIESDGLVKIYKTGEVEVMALQGLDLEIEKGELLAIIGNSGSGKSTFLNLIGGLEKPSAGRLYVDGKDLFKMTENELVNYKQSTVGFVWQKSSRNLFPYLTAIKNIEAPMRFTKGSSLEKRSRALELLDAVGLINKKDSYPHQMSGGEQQRIGIAIALANNPKLLLADEPTGAVDVKTSNYIQDMFRSFNRELGLSIVIVTHDLSLSKKVNRVVMIRDGKISSEKIMREEYYDKINDVSFKEMESHDEYIVMDKAGRIQLTPEIREQAGITDIRLKMAVEGNKIIITQ